MLEVDTYNFLLLQNFECSIRKNQPNLGNLTLGTNAMAELYYLAKIFVWVSDSLKSLEGNQFLQMAN